MSRAPDFAASRAALTPGALAFADHGTGRDWTFAEVDAAARQVAAGLAGMGLAPGARVAILCLNRAEFFVALFACRKAGMILAPLNWRQPVTELRPVAESVGCAALIHDAAHAEVAAALALPCIPLRADGGFGGFGAGQTLPSDPGPDEGDPWYLLFTSGTTGLPKAVVQTAKMAAANAMNIAQAVGLTGGDTTVNFLPLFHTAGINLYTLPVFLWGGTTHVLPRFDADDLAALIRDGRISLFFGVPAIYLALSRHPGLDGLDLTRVRFGCGGAALPEALIELFAQRGALICNGYGMTETGPTGFLLDPAAALEKIGSVGKPQMMTEVRLAGVPDGVAGTGEILLRGATVTPGYFGNEAATRAAFDPEGWLRSGDVARRDAEGFYTIVDRIKDMFISGGENVYPAEVERILITHPDILEAAVIGVPDERWGEVGRAFLIARPGRSPDPDALRGWCRERLAGYKVPATFRLVTDFPRTAAGKVRKPLLREME